MSRKDIKEVVFLDNKELTDEQIEETRVTYDVNADSYVLNYERRAGALDEARLFTLDPFLKAVEKNKPGGKILFAGCGSGRDMEEALRSGFKCVGIDISLHMLNIGKIVGIKAPMMKMDIESMDFPNDSFDGIFCDTAITHIKVKGIDPVLQKFKDLLVDGGHLFVSFRRGNGTVYKTEDKVGTRYYTTVSAKRSEKYLKQLNFEIIGRSSHKVGIRPAYYNLLATNNKKK